MAKKLFICVPCYGGQVYSGFFSSMLNLVTELKNSSIEYEISIVDNDSLVTRGRNRLIYRFIKSDCTHCIFIDADITFTANSIIYMLDINKDILGGCYPKKQLNMEKIKKSNTNAIQTLAESSDYVVSGLEKTVDDLKECQYIGTGFLMVKRIVYEKLYSLQNIDKYYCPMEQGWIKEVFKTGVVDKVYLSEDYYFCKIVQELGYKIYTDSKISLNHTGQFTFIGCLKLAL